MMFYKQLKKNIIYYLIAGIVFSLFLFTAIILNKYEKHISDEINKTISVKIKIIEMNHKRADMESEIKYIESSLPSDFNKKAPQEFIFMALDDIKMTLPWSEVGTANTIEEKDSELSLSVNIKVPVYNYTTLLNYIGYLESLKFPYYTIENVTITKLQQPPENVTCNIKGILRMPITSGKKI